MKKMTLALGFLFLTATACIKTSNDQSTGSSERRRPIGVYHVIPTDIAQAGARNSGTTVFESISRKTMAIITPVRSMITIGATTMIIRTPVFGKN